MSDQQIAPECAERCQMSVDYGTREYGCTGVCAYLSRAAAPPPVRAETPTPRNDAERVHDLRARLTASEAEVTALRADRDRLTRQLSSVCEDTSLAKDYRRLTGCAHARHEACANCTCNECGQRVVRGMVHGRVICLPVDVALGSVADQPETS